jgi:dCTP deaminase
MGIDPCFCPAEVGFNVRTVIADHTTLHDLTLGHYRLPPHGFILGWTKEKLRLPHASRVCARVEGKSSLARLGLGVHVTAPTIHAGFGTGKEGDALQLEIWNVGPLPIELRYEMRVCQLIFEELHGTPVKGYAGQFLDQGPKPSE